MDFDNEFMQNTAQEATEADRVFLNPDLDAEVTITLEPTDTVQLTVTEILGDVDGRLLEDRALEYTKIFTEPTAKSAPKPPKRAPTPPRGRGTSRSQQPLHAEALDAVTTPRTSMEFGC